MGKKNGVNSVVVAYRVPVEVWDWMEAQANEVEKGVNEWARDDMVGAFRGIVTPPVTIRAVEPVRKERKYWSRGEVVSLGDEYLFRVGKALVVRRCVGYDGQDEPEWEDVPE
jgi:hypothetical protein